MCLVTPAVNQFYKQQKSFSKKKLKAFVFF